MVTVGVDWVVAVSAAVSAAALIDEVPPTARTKPMTDLIDAM